MRIRTRRASAVLLSLVLGAAGCGGSDEGAGTESEPVRPLLAAPVAERLAARSDAVAADLAAGDVCGAAHEADVLHGEALAAVEAGEVPPALRDELLATARALVDAVNCPPPAPAVDDADDDEGADDGPGKGKKQGKKEGEKKKGKQGKERE